VPDHKTITTTFTRDCPNTCGLLARVENGRLIGLVGDPEHPLTRGICCMKAEKYVKRVYSPERVTFPLIRKDGEWTRASWDQALDLIARRMQSIKAQSGPEALLYYQGYGERTALKILNNYFFALFGGVTTLRGSLCGGTGQSSQNLDFGERISHDPLDHLNSSSMILWGRNPVSTNVSLVPIMKELQKRGAPIILVDPANSKTAPLADRHIKPRPGGDAYLAMAAAKLILDAGAEDRSFLTQHSIGFGEYKAILDRYSLDDLYTLADVSAEDAVFLAETLMQHKPTSILLGWGLHRHRHAHLSIRTVDALGAVAGLIGRPGGGVSQGFEEYGPYDQNLWGHDLHPTRRTLLMPTIGEEILKAQDPPIRMIYVTASNPVGMAPNTNKTIEAFQQAEFVVYSGHFQDDTSDYADVFLPATTFLEEEDVVASYGHNYVGPVNRAIAPVGECKSEFQMFYELAERFDFAEDFRHEVETWLQKLCAPLWEQGHSLKDVLEGPVRWAAPLVPYEDKSFPTASGKYQFMTEFPGEAPSQITPEYPYRLLTIAAHKFICSERTMAEHDALPVVSLNSAEAEKRGLRGGMLVSVKSPVGKARARLALDPTLRPDVLSTERGGWAKAGHGLNRLTHDMASEVGMGAPYYETAVTVEAETEAPFLGKKILVVHNSPTSNGGVFCKELERQGVEQTHLHMTKGDALPASHADYDGIAVFGGPQNAYDDEASPYLAELTLLLRAFDEARKPVMGICLGSQLLARAYGGAHADLGRMEIGFTQLKLTPAGEKDPVLSAALPIPPLMEIHQDTMLLPAEAELLMRSDDCENQCFRIGNCSYGVQFHPEADSAVIAMWIERFRTGQYPGYTHHLEYLGDAEFDAVLQDIPLYMGRSEAFCRRLAQSWLALTLQESACCPPSF
jgi:anaerobic selenocysteine-containing dehydrogenase/GMP synthase-like glutamine amidotransferase